MKHGLGNQFLLLKGCLAFGFTMSHLVYNLKYWYQQAGVHFYRISCVPIHDGYFSIFDWLPR